MNLLTFDLNLLRVLDALLQEQSTVNAGKRLGLSQSAVSAALGRLRHALNDPLFVRQGQRIVPTDFATKLELPLRRVLDDVQALLAGPPAFDPGTSTQSYKISGSDFFAEMLMPALAEVQSARAPRMRIQLVDLVPDNYVGTLENREIDMALIPDTAFPDWIDRRPLFYSGFAMVARHGHPALEAAGVAPGAVVPIDLFCELGHVLFSPEGKLRAMGDAALARVGRERRVVMTQPVFSGVASAVAASDLVGLMPSQLARRMAGRLGLSIYRPPMPIDPALICMVWHKRSSGNPGHGWLRDVVQQILAPLDDGTGPSGAVSPPAVPGSGAGGS